MKYGTTRDTYRTKWTRNLRFPLTEGSGTTLVDPTSVTVVCLLRSRALRFRKTRLRLPLSLSIKIVEGGPTPLLRLPPLPTTGLVWGRPRTVTGTSVRRQLKTYFNGGLRLTVYRGIETETYFFVLTASFRDVEGHTAFSRVGSDGRREGSKIGWDSCQGRGLAAGRLGRRLGRLQSSLRHWVTRTCPLCHWIGPDRLPGQLHHSSVTSYRDRESRNEVTDLRGP